MKTGGWGLPWVTLESPKPPRVDRYAYWGTAPDEPSPRCVFWLRQIGRGWRPNCHIQRMGYDESAEWYGVFMWEYLNVLAPRLSLSFNLAGPSM